MDPVLSLLQKWRKWEREREIREEKRELAGQDGKGKLGSGEGKQRREDRAPL